MDIFWKLPYIVGLTIVWGGKLEVSLTHLMPVLPSYRNQSIDLQSKSIDWFLYEGNTGI